MRDNNKLQGLYLFTIFDPQGICLLFSPCFITSILVALLSFTHFVIKNFQPHLILFSQTIRTSSLDFAAGLASLRSSHVTVLNNNTKAKAPDGLKFHKVIPHSHFNAYLLPKWARLFSNTLCHLSCWANSLRLLVSLLFFRAWLISKPAKISCPTRSHGRCVICVLSLSTSYRDIWLTEESTIAAVSGNSAVHKVTAAFLFYFICFIYCFF